MLHAAILNTYHWNTLEYNLFLESSFFWLWGVSKRKLNIYSVWSKMIDENAYVIVWQTYANAILMYTSLGIWEWFSKTVFGDQNCHYESAVTSAYLSSPFSMHRWN